MNFESLSHKMLKQSGVELSTMMNTPCLRFKGKFFCMWFDKADALIIKVPSNRVNELINEGTGLEFNFTKKKFKEWVLIPKTQEEQYEEFALEALDYARQ